MEKIYTWNAFSFRSSWKRACLHKHRLALLWFREGQDRELQLRAVVASSHRTPRASKLSRGTRNCSWNKNTTPCTWLSQSQAQGHLCLWGTAKQTPRAERRGHTDVFLHCFLGVKSCLQQEIGLRLNFLLSYSKIFSFLPF